MLQRLVFILVLSSYLLSRSVVASDFFTSDLLAIDQEAATETQTRWMSEQYPPYNYLDQQEQPQGIAVEMLAAMWKKLSVPAQPLEFLPWARSYALLLREPQTALFSMTYTPTREQLFRFVGPIIATRVVLLAPRSAELQIISPTEINALSIGVVRDDIGESLLDELGVTPQQIIYSNQADNLIQLLHRGRVDAIAYSYDVAVWNMRQADIDPQAYENVFTLLEGQLGFAFHAQTPASWLERLQQALAEVEASGEAEQIRQRYLNQQGKMDPTTMVNESALSSPYTNPSSQAEDSSSTPR